MNGLLDALQTAGRDRAEEPQPLPEDAACPVLSLLEPAAMPARRNDTVPRLESRPPETLPSGRIHAGPQLDTAEDRAPVVLPSLLRRARRRTLVLAAILTIAGAGTCAYWAGAYWLKSPPPSPSLVMATPLRASPVPSARDIPADRAAPDTAHEPPPAVSSSSSGTRARRAASAIRAEDLPRPDASAPLQTALATARAGEPMSTPQEEAPGVQEEPKPQDNDAAVPVVIADARDARKDARPSAAMAWEKLRDGRPDEAEALYEEVLRDDPRNVDGRLGLAAIAARRGQKDDAARHFSEALKVDPRQAEARAGLLTLIGEADPQQAELLLLQALAADPDAAIYFALGNLYAANGHWARAREAYFRAHRARTDNRDYVYNLAVALDHLGHRKAALRYYRLALEQATDPIQPGFERARLEQRIARLAEDEHGR